MATRDDIATEARRWLGVPWKHEGRNKFGIDCVGLLIRVANDLGISEFDIDGYSRVPSGHMMSRMMAEHMEKIDINEIGSGDVLHLRYDGQPQHIAIVSNTVPFRIIHADNITGKVIEHGLDASWRSMIRGCYRVPV